MDITRMDFTQQEIDWILEAKEKNFKFIFTVFDMRTLHDKTKNRLSPIFIKTEEELHFKRLEYQTGPVRIKDIIDISEVYADYELRDLLHNIVTARKIMALTDNQEILKLVSSFTFVTGFQH